MKQRAQKEYAALASTTTNTVQAATKDFSKDNELGRGSFGAVYKGMLKDGKEIVVKRLAFNSEQGVEEFKNEVVLVAKLQHRNLVRLLGFSIHEHERLLIYEFLPNASLDQILFDAEMNAKIADFGMAKLFKQNETQAQTSRIVGTRAYMHPEYIINGHFSLKIDVYSFGVLVLEIVASQRNHDFQNGETIQNLPSFYGVKLIFNLLPPHYMLWHMRELLELLVSSDHDRSKI
nr:cysteine-rich receptor-like protein kinase 7 isoform X3 [Tanacetum cinerariifolium]